ncbi:MAG: hypothetical protein HQL28_04100 [Candidatus Omnitrophica bacterium]|nr:hypothetical protein [Candidatus Omnitrophota bacterium]
MKLRLTDQPRKFHIRDGNITISDHGKIELNADEMVSFVTASGRECDFTAKKWGYYPTSSLNSRMKKEGFKTALVKNPDGKININVVEEDRIGEFDEYLKSHEFPPKVVCWLDELTLEEVQKIEKALLSA